MRAWYCAYSARRLLAGERVSRLLFLDVLRVAVDVDDLFFLEEEDDIMDCFILRLSVASLRLYSIVLRSFCMDPMISLDVLDAVDDDDDEALLLFFKRSSR